MVGVTLHHGEEGRLIAGVEAEPESETIRKRDRLLHRFAGVDGGRALVVDHVAQHQMAPVRGRIEQDVVRPAADPAFQRRLQGLVGRVLGLEGEVVAEEEALIAAAAQTPKQDRQGRDLFPVNLYQLQAARVLRRHDSVHRLDERALAHSSGTPQQGIVGRQAAGEAPRVVEQDVADPVDALEQRELQPIDLGHGLKPRAVGVPDKSIRQLKPRIVRPGGRETLQRFRDALEEWRQLRVRHACTGWLESARRGP